MKVRFLIATGLLAIVLSPIRAAAITVTTTSDSGPGSLRDALAVATDGDTINFSVTGTITLTSGELLVTNSVDIVGPGPANLAVDGNASSRVFHIAPSNTVTICGLTITNGIENITGGFRDSGGGIYNDHSALAVSNCAVKGNSTQSWGGGIFDNGMGFGRATLTLINTTVSDNSAGLGGGIFNWHATLTMVNSTLTGNSAFIGGGVGNNHAALTASNCTVSANSAIPFPDAPASGGGIYSHGDVSGSATLTLINSTVSGNSAEFGGGIYNGGRASVQIVNSTLSGNEAHLGSFLCARCTSGGGGIFNNGSGGSASLQMVNSTLSGNSAESGGGIFNGGSATLEIGNAILDTGASGANITNAAGTVASLGYNLSSDDGGGFLTAAGDRTNTDPMLGPLQDNGGPTFTHALLCGSPAIDQGKRDTIPDLATDTDQRGLPRPFNDPLVANASGSDGSDIGAFERQTVCNRPPVAKCKSVTASADANCTATASIDDGSFDPDDGDTITLSQSPAGPYGLGMTTVTLTVTDSHGVSDRCTATVTVVDDTAPIISAVSVDKPVLWPPNHKLVNVAVRYQAADNCDPSPTCTLSVTSNARISGRCVGHTVPDWVIVDAHHVRLRAERTGKGDGRIYTITITCTDDYGNVATKTATVTVPKHHRILRWRLVGLDLPVRP